MLGENFTSDQDQKQYSPPPQKKSKKKLIVSLVIIPLFVSVLAVASFVGFNFYKDRNVVKIDQTDTPSLELVKQLEQLAANEENESDMEEIRPAQEEPTSTPTVTPTPVSNLEPTPTPTAVSAVTPAPTPTSTPASTPTPTPTPPPAPRSGTFTGNNGYTATGTATVLDVNGQKALSFSSSFSADSAPDLVVYLAKNNAQAEGTVGEFVSLGSLQSNSGAQVYNLPVNADDFNSVVIWCRAFSVQFGAADLS